MQLKDFEKGIGMTIVALDRDELVPDCGYCADMGYWHCSQISGSFKGLTGKCEGFPDGEGCVPEMVQMRAHSFTLHSKAEGGSCFSGNEVAALMSDRDTFEQYQNISRTGDVSLQDDKTCVTTADMKSYVAGDPLINYFDNGQAILCMILSFLLGFLTSAYLTRAIYRILYRAGRINNIASLILQNPEALSDLRFVMSESQKFGIQKKADDHPDQYQQDQVESQPLTRADRARVALELSLAQIPHQKSVLARLLEGTGLRSRRPPKMQAVKIADLSTARSIPVYSYCSS